jgi:hypothetical protein
MHARGSVACEPAPGFSQGCGACAAETLASFQEKDAALRAQMEELIRNSSRLKMLMGTFLHQHIGVLQVQHCSSPWVHAGSLLAAESALQ